ncbi:hypothetical protein DYI25_07185 [Mesobacillus boroniphilus]|uniref:Uncharacterized protein n=1 Tax=Mesobacillus boroniphilus TaxID=308892 RepID=A0A944GW12_9BACI|nr:hypothetical protein [Mesobacillus boroniphilus]
MICYKYLNVKKMKTVFWVDYSLIFVPVYLGNIVSGGVFIALFYWRASENKRCNRKIKFHRQAFKKG